MLKETPYAFYIYMDRRLEIYESVDQNFHLVGVSKSFKEKLFWETSMRPY